MPITWDAETLAQVARSLKRGKAPGECDGTHYVLQAALFCCPPGLRTPPCLALVNAMLAFKVPRVDALLNSKTLASVKHRGQGIRPVAICEACLRLAAIVCMRLIPDAGPSLASLQLGVRIQGRADDIGHAINAALRVNPASTEVLSHDWPNAFKPTDHFAAMASRHPSLVPFANLMYGAYFTVRFIPTSSQVPLKLHPPVGYAK
jgi:hypothetical protein